jgi:uncharacterized protein
MIDTPFIHLIKSRYGYYFFDVNINKIVNISEDTYEYLRNMINNREYRHLYTPSVKCEYEKLKASGYLKNKRPTNIEMHDLHNIDYYLNYRLQKLTLQITQACNFRCSYCHYTYGDDINYHSHKSNNMNWETAKKAIDFFAKRTRDTAVINIGFYGGEPLLEYKLFEKCIAYCNNVFEGKILTYSLTTNAALLTPDITKYLIDNNTSILVSLDGPKEIHDKNRKFAYDGSGSFDIVYENLDKIKIELPEYFTKIRFNSVIDPANDCSKINNFFACDLFGDRDVTTPIVNPTQNKTIYYSPEFIKNYKNDMLSAFLCKINVFDKSALSKIAINYYGLLIGTEKALSTLHEIPDKLGHSGPCKPGVFRLFVSINGDFYPCEKLNDSSNVMKIGSLEGGFDIENIKKIYNVTEITKEKCENCWNIIHCKICAPKLDDGNELSKNLAIKECKNSCYDTEVEFKSFIALLESEAMIYK